MTRIRAHFDGKVIIPDEQVSLPINVPLEIEIFVMTSPKQETAVTPDIQERLRKLEKATGHIDGPALTHEALRRESFYDDDAQ